MASDPVERTRFIEHQGREILLYDFAGLTDVPLAGAAPPVRP